MEKKSIKVYNSLSPENAQNYGYECEGDMIYDPDAPEIANQDIFELVNDGYLLGQPAGRMGSSSAVGIYAPIPNAKQTLPAD